MLNLSTDDAVRFADPTGPQAATEDTGPAATEPDDIDPTVTAAPDPADEPDVAAEETTVPEEDAGAEDPGEPVDGTAVPHEGLTWEPVMEAEPLAEGGMLNMNDVVWTGTAFVAAGLAVAEPESVGGLWRSVDGTQWECFHCGADEGSFQFHALEPLGEGGFVAAGQISGAEGPEPTLWVSDDGTALDHAVPLPTEGVVTDVAYRDAPDDSRLLLTTQVSTDDTGTAELWQAADPSDPASWEQSALPSDADQPPITELEAFGDRVFGLTESEGVYLSEDGGGSWMFRSADEAGLGGLRSFTSLVEHDGRFLMAAAAGEPDESAELTENGGGVLLASEDGLAWEQVADITGRAELGYPAVVEDLFVTAGGALIAVGSSEGTPAERQAAAWSSTDDGQSWAADTIGMESHSPDLDQELDAERMAAVAQSDDSTLITAGSLRAPFPGFWVYANSDVDEEGG